MAVNLSVSFSEGKIGVLENKVLDIRGRKQTIYELLYVELRNFYYQADILV
jgi:hypothetical protein